MSLRRRLLPGSPRDSGLDVELTESLRIAASAQRAGAQQHPSPVRSHSREHVRVSVVIPTLNEAENLQFVLPKIPPEMEEIVVVDGHSTDGTRERALQLRPEAIVIRQDGVGKGAALRSGFAACSGDIIVMLDADGSTDPAEIPAFVGALLAGADFAKGSRFVQGGGTADMPFHRRLGNKVFVLLVRLFFGSRYSDLCYGYNAFWSDVISRLDLDADGFEIETMMNIRALRVGLNVTEVASFEHRRRYGEGRLKIVPDGWRVFKTIIAERLNRGGFDPRPGSPAPSSAEERSLDKVE
jgi:glycosyltransferase involved in cell wall biosynthesis